MNKFDEYNMRKLFIGMIIIIGSSLRNEIGK